LDGGTGTEKKKQRFQLGKIIFCRPCRAKKKGIESESGRGRGGGQGDDEAKRGGKVGKKANVIG